jgi:hypothetical protein
VGRECVYNATAESTVEKGKEEKSKSHTSLFLSLFLSSSKNNMIVCPDGELDKNTSFISKIPPQKKHGSF